jgi:O-antigen/teichoic acid export membrane protein
MNGDWLSSLKTQCQEKGTGLFYTASSLFLSFSMILGNFVSARWLTPFEYGSVQAAFLLINYLWFLSLGVLQGFTQRYPILLGGGRAEEGEGLARSAHAFIRIVAAAGMAAALIQFLIFSWKGVAGIMQIAALANVFYIGSDFASGIHHGTLAGRRRFGFLAWVRIAQGVAGLAMLAAVWAWGATGQSARLLAIALVNWFMVRWGSRDILTGPVAWSAIPSLIRIGVPIALASCLLGVFAVLDRTVIAWTMGSEDLGNYSVAGFVMLAVQGFLVPVSMLFYTKANHALGATGNPASLVPILRRYLGIMLIVSGAAAAALYALLPPLVHALLPKYELGIRAGQIACVGAVAQCLAGTSFAYFTIGRNWRLMAITAAVVAVFLIAFFLLPTAGRTLENVAALRAFTTLALAAAVNGVLLACLRPRRTSPAAT